MTETHLPVWVAYMQALGPLIVTIAVACLSAYLVYQQISVAREQAMFAREKLKHDLFDRRYGIYLAFDRMIRCMMGQDGLGTDEENLLAANISAAQAVFILDDAVSDYLFDLHNIAFRKTRYSEVIKISDLPPEVIQKQTTQWMEDTQTILHAIPVLSQKFRPFLRLKDFRAI
jgi:hypothetical protein